MTSPSADFELPILSPQIQKMIPHRYPFLLVDKILDYNLDEGWIVGQKNVTINEGFFNGHFPGAPIMPGVLIIEAMAQCGGVLIHLKGCRDKTAVLLSIRQGKFRKPVKPGDVLTLRCEELRLSSLGGKVKATASVDGVVVTEGEVGFALVDKESI